MFRTAIRLLPLLQSESESGGGGTSDQKSEEKKSEEEVRFDARQQEKVNDLIAAERKRTEEATAARIKAEADEKQRKADADAKRKRDEDAGEFDKVKQSLEAERDEAKASLETATAELDTLRAHVNGDIDAALKDDAFKPFLRFDPGKDALIATRLKWLADARKSIDDMPKDRQRGNGPDKKPAHGEFDLQAEIARARQRGNYRV